jgi:hypothetical protein
MQIHRVAGPVAAAGLLLVCAPTPPAALSVLREPASPTDASAPLIALVALLAWALLGWLTAVAGCLAAARLPGIAGQAGALVSRRIAPAALRRAVETALGLTLAAAALGSTPAFASDATPARPPALPAAAALDWPSPAVDLDWNPTAAPAPAAPALPAVAPSAAARSSAAVVVRPGDSLWAIAGDHLPGRPSGAQIAAAWPAWWAANRDAVGSNPDLIEPGLRLTPPASS